MLYVLVTLAPGIGQDGASLKDQFCVYRIAGVLVIANCLIRLQRIFCLINYYSKYTVYFVEVYYTCKSQILQK